MQWKDSGNTDFENGESEKDYYEEEYSSFKTKTTNIILSKFLNLTKMPYSLIGIGIIILIILFVIFSPGRQNDVTKQKIMSLYAELKLLEGRLDKLEGLGKRLVLIEKHDKKNEKFRDRINKSEAFLSTRINEMAKRMDKLEKKTAKVKQTQIDSRKDAKDSTDGAHPRYHQVKAGDTLYSISRRYGLKVDELQKLNKLSPGKTIYPGQKLVVGHVNSN